MFSSRRGKWASSRCLAPCRGHLRPILGCLRDRNCLDLLSGIFLLTLGELSVFQPVAVCRGAVAKNDFDSSAAIERLEYRNYSRAFDT